MFSGRKKRIGTAVEAEEEEGEDDENENEEKEEEVVEVIACGCVGPYRTKVEVKVREGDREKVARGSKRGRSKRRIGRA